MSDLKVCVIGTGYVGLVSGTCFADIGHTVYCIDVDPDKIAQIEGGTVPIYEPGLDELVARNQEPVVCIFRPGSRMRSRRGATCSSSPSARRHRPEMAALTCAMC